MFSVERATPSNGLFQQLREQWDGSLATYNEDPAFFRLPFLEHAEKIANESPPSSNYGIYILRDEHGTFHGLFHANLARLPKTSGKTLRVLWILSAPKYEFEDVSETDMALLISSVLVGSLNLAEGEMDANHLKILLDGQAERRFAHGFAFHAKGKLTKIVVEVRGAWLHMDNIR